MHLTRHAHSSMRPVRSSSSRPVLQHSKAPISHWHHCSSNVPSQSAARQQQQCKAISSDPEANQEFELVMSAASPEELQCDQKWISSLIATWLDEEWTPLEVHQQLGEAAGAAYVKCRQAGEDEMTSLLMGLSNELLAFNYRETFVNAFEVSNKVVEILMMRQGIDVCCTTDEDVQRMQRLSSSDTNST